MDSTKKVFKYLNEWDQMVKMTNCYERQMVIFFLANGQTWQDTESTVLDLGNGIVPDKIFNLAGKGWSRRTCQRSS